MVAFKGFFISSQELRDMAIMGPVRLGSGSPGGERKAESKIDLELVVLQKLFPKVP